MLRARLTGLPWSWLSARASSSRLLSIRSAILSERSQLSQTVLETFDNVHAPEQHGRPGLVAEPGPGGVGGLGGAHGSLHILGHGVGQVGVHAARGGVHAGEGEKVQYTDATADTTSQ